MSQNWKISISRMPGPGEVGAPAPPPPKTESKLPSIAIFILTVLVLGLTAGIVVVSVRLNEQQVEEVNSDDVCLTEGCATAGQEPGDGYQAAPHHAYMYY